MSRWATIYVIHCSGLYKIGYTWGSVSQRISTLQIGNPNKITLVCELPTEYPTQVEQDLHSIFNCCHVRGEWYRLSAHNVRSLKAEAQIARTEYVRWQLQRNQDIASGEWQ